MEVRGDAMADFVHPQHGSRFSTLDIGHVDVEWQIVELGVGRLLEAIGTSLSPFCVRRRSRRKQLQRAPFPRVCVSVWAQLCYGSAVMGVPKAVARHDAERGLWVVVSCPYCGRRNRHQHGAGGPQDDPIEFLGNRVADCGGVLATYDLVGAGEPYTSGRIDYDRSATAAAAKASGIPRRVWDREYRGRVTPLTEAELRARGDYLGCASGW